MRRSLVRVSLRVIENQGSFRVRVVFLMTLFYKSLFLLFTRDRLVLH